MASRRTYTDAVSWIKSARTRDFSRGRFAGRIFGAFFLAGLVGFGLASLVSPSSFGQEGGRVLSLGWRTVVLVAMIGAGAIVLAINRRRITGLFTRNLTRPYDLRPGEDRPYEAAVNALASCPRLLQIRFAVAWSWGPALAATIGAVLAVSAAYFAIYSTLAGFDVGAQTAAVAAGDVVIGFGLFVVAAAKLATWRLATATYRAVAPSYLG